MKKILLATTLLAAGAGMAAADVTISGYGRFGLTYNELATGNTSKTILSSRLRINIDATTETDVGVTFGARMRLQYDDGMSGKVGGNAAQFTVGYEGLTVGVGNIDTAFDSVKLTYDSEMGYEDSSFGDAQSAFFAYNSGSQDAGYQGVSATYSFGDINTYFSYVNPDQYVRDLGFAQLTATTAVQVEEEVGIAADWSNGAFTVAGSYVNSGAGIKGNDLLFIGAAYSFGDATVGLNYYDNGGADVYDLAGTVKLGEVEVGDQVTLYGNYKFGATTLRAYVSDIDVSGADTAYGIGADYSLGSGARLSGSIQSGFASQTVADVGVRFNF